MGYSHKYDAFYDDETGEWLDKVGFCKEGEECEYCIAYNKDGRPKTAFEAPKDARDI